MAGEYVVFLPVLTPLPPRTILAPPQLHPHPPPHVYTVPFYGEGIQVTVAKKAAHVHQWVSTIRHLYRHSFENNILLVGLDTEWLPNLSPGDDHPIAILQLCVGRHCLLYQLLHTDGIPVSLRAFLANPLHKFYGIGIKDDVKKLYDHHGLGVNNTTDLNLLAKFMRIEDRENYRYMGLKKMAKVFLKKEMKKPLEVTLSKWDNIDLDHDQVEYAAIDAYVSFQLALALYNSRDKVNL